MLETPRQGQRWPELTNSGLALTCVTLSLARSRCKSGQSPIPGAQLWEGVRQSPQLSQQSGLTALQTARLRGQWVPL